MPDPTKKTDEPTVLPGEMEDALVTVTLAGKTEQVSVAALRDRFQKEQVAESRFREAHEIKSAAEAALDVAADLQQGFADRDSAKIRRAFRNSGLSDDDCDSIFAGAGGAVSGADTAPPGAEADNPTGSEVGDADSDERVVQLLDQVAELQKVVGGMQEDKKLSARQKKEQGVLREVDKALDNDPELSLRLKELAPEDQQELREMAYKQVAKASKTTPWGPRAIQEGLKLLKAHSKLWGGNRGTSESGEGTPGAPAPGFGPSGHSASHIHQTTGTKPVGVYDPGYATNLLKRLGEKLGRGR